MANKYPVANLASGDTFNWSTGGNWNGGTVPVDADFIFLRNMASNISAGLDQSLVQPAATFIEASMAGTIGTAAGAYLQLGGGRIVIGEQYPGITAVGPTRCLLDFGTDAADVTILRCGTPADAGLETIRLKGSHATLNKLHILGTGGSGSVGLGTTLPTESGIVFNDVNHTDGLFTAAGGATLKNYIGRGGTARLLNAWDAAGVLTQEGGQRLYLMGTGLLPTASINGYCYHGQRRSGAATHTNLSILGGGVVDCQFDPRAWTMTNAIKMHEGSRLRLWNPAQVTLQAGGAQTFTPQGCEMGDVTIESGLSPTLTVG